MGTFVVSSFADWASIGADTIEQGLTERLILMALSGQAMASNHILLDTPVSLPRTGSMAGGSIAWTLDEEFRVFGATAGRLLAGMSLDNARPLDVSNFRGVLRMPEACGIKIDVWSECVRADFPGLEQNGRIVDYTILLQQAVVLERALGVIRSAAAPAFDEILLVLQTAAPLVSDGRSLPSSSNSAITGVIWYSETNVPELLAEMIMHEFSHSKVFLLQDFDPLLDRSKHGSGWESCEFYSPWRDDPRPLNAILHGYFVFSEAALFWARCLKNNASVDHSLACRRFGLLVRQIELARNVLERECSFTAGGRAIMQYFAERLDDALLPLARGLNTDALPVLHLERHTEFEFRSAMTIASSVAAHRDLWGSRYGVPAVML